MALNIDCPTWNSFLATAVRQFCSGLKLAALMPQVQADGPAPHLPTMCVTEQIVASRAAILF